MPLAGSDLGSLGCARNTEPADPLAVKREPDTTVVELRVDYPSTLSLTRLARFEPTWGHTDTTPAVIQIRHILSALILAASALFNPTDHVDETMFQLWDFFLLGRIFFGYLRR